MSGMPGRMQAGFTAGEIDIRLYDRTSLKYFSTGAAHMENVVVIPQGGFTLRDGLRHIGELPDDAARILPFAASDGTAYDLVFGPEYFQVWDAGEMLQEVETIITEPMLAGMTDAQQLDTMIVFHKDLKSQRIKILAADDWEIEDAPFRNIPRYDYGDEYTNGEAARWQLRFVGLEDAETIFKITVSGHDTVSITFNTNTEAMANDIKAKVLALPNVATGIDTITVANRVTIIFSGELNIGDAWAVSAVVINKADAAILSSKNVVGVIPGEAVLSDTRGYARCGVFYQQRLFMGGFKSLPNAYLVSMVGQYYQFDERFTEANGPFLVPMDIDGGEAIVRMADNLNMLIFTSEGEYWLGERTVSKTEAPNHVNASRNGAKEGVPVIANEGAALFCHGNGNVLGEMRYTDVDGNFIATDVSLLAPHLINGVIDLAGRKSTNSTSGNLLVVVGADGKVTIGTMLRQQEVTAYARMTSDGLAKAVARNSRNEVSFIYDRDGTMALERMEGGLLLDEAVSFDFEVATSDIEDLGRFEGRAVWAIADGDVFGPFTVTGGAITLPAPAEAVTVGTWRAPKVTTLPPSREVGPNTILRRKARIHTVHLSLIDTTSVAIAVNGGTPFDIDLGRYGTVLADVAELDQGFTGVIKIPGLRGFADEPNVSITQVRPGRFTVRSLTIEAQF